MKPQPLYTVLVLALFCRFESNFFIFFYYVPVFPVASKTKNAAKMRPKLVLCCISGFFENNNFTFVSSRGGHIRRCFLMVGLNKTTVWQAVNTFEILTEYFPPWCLPQLPLLQMLQQLAGPRLLLLRPSLQLASHRCHLFFFLTASSPPQRYQM